MNRNAVTSLWLSTLLFACSFDQRLKSTASIDPPSGESSGPTGPSVEASGPSTRPPGPSAEPTGPSAQPTGPVAGTFTEVDGNGPLLHATCTRNVFDMSCTCPAGYSPDGEYCVLESIAAELATGCWPSSTTDGVCAGLVTCVDAAQGFTCTCDPGSELVGQTCVAVAGVNPDCVASGNAFSCTCDHRMSAHVSACDAVEVLQPAQCVCPAHAQCTVIAGGYRCDCAEGFDLVQANGFECVSQPLPPRTIAEPTRVGTDTWLSVSTQLHHTCGVKTDGTWWCWGQIKRGESSPMTRIGSDSDWSFTLDARSFWSCAVKVDGSIWCFDDWHGVAEELPAMVEAGPRSSYVKDYRAACGIAADGALACEAIAAYGVSAAGFDSDVPYTVGTEHDWVDFSLGARAGSGPACGIRETAPDQRELWCWGDNATGALALGYAGGVAQLPQRAASASDDWLTVKMSTEFGCGLRGPVGSATLWCWGADSGIGSGGSLHPGQLGVGAGASDGMTPTQATPYDDYVSLYVMTADSNVGPRFTACAIRDTAGARTLWCWPSQTPDLLPVQVGSDGDWQSVAVSLGYPAWQCGIRTDGSLWCWGNDDDGQLGLPH